MKKIDMINEIKENVNVDCVITKVYGVPFGVGYDLNVYLTHKEDKNVIMCRLKAHATRQSWSLLGHLREYESRFNTYTGKNDVYRDQVMAWWENKDALEDYFMRMSKKDLTYYHCIVMKVASRDLK